MLYGRIENTMPTPSRLYREAARRGLAVGFVSRDQSGLNALLSSEENVVSTDNFQITHKRKPKQRMPFGVPTVFAIIITNKRPLAINCRLLLLPQQF